GSFAAQALETTSTGGLDNEGDGSVINVKTTGNLSVDKATGFRSVTLSTAGGSGAIDAGVLVGGSSGINLATGSGLLTVDSATGGGNVTLGTSGGDIIAGPLQSTSAVVTVDGAKVTLADVTSGTNIVLTASGDLDAGNLLATRDLTLTAGGKAVLVTAAAGDDIRAVAASFAATTLETTGTGGLDSEGDGSVIKVTAGSGDLVLGSANGNRHLTLIAQSGKISANLLETNTGDVSVTANGSGAIAVVGVDAAGNVALAAKPGVSITSNSVVSRTASVSITGGTLGLGEVSADRNIALDASTDILVTKLTAARDLGIDAVGTVTVGEAAAGDDLVVNAGNSDLSALKTTSTGGLDSEGDGSNVRVTTTGLLKAGSVAAHRSAVLTSQNGAIVAGAIATQTGGVTFTSATTIAYDTIDSNTAVALKSLGSAAIGGGKIQSQTSTITVTGGGLTLGDLKAGTNIVLTGAGDVTAGALVGVRDTTVSSAGLVTLASATAGDDLIINADTTMLGPLSATGTGGLDNEGDGSNIRINTQGL
ncbi:MAG TPA: hypothetical protein VGF99_01730, partial [Myxococcota bacterium]